MWNFKCWKSALLLSVILPMSLFITFRLTGTLHGPATISKTITASTVNWNMSRSAGYPNGYALLDKWVKNFYTDTTVSVSLGVHVVDYTENFQEYPAWGNDYLRLRIIANASVSQGFIYSVVIRFSEIDNNGVLEIHESQETLKLTGLRITNVEWYSTYKHEAYVEAVGTGQPKTCSLTALVFWILSNKANVDCWQTTMLEVVFFDGAEYKKVEVPIHMGALIP